MQLFITTAAVIFSIGHGLCLLLIDSAYHSPRENCQTEICTVSYIDRYIGLNFPSLHRNDFAQLHLHCSHQDDQSTIGLYTKHDKMSGICSGSLPKCKSTLLWFIVYLFLEFHQNTTINFELSCKQTKKPKDKRR